MKNDTNKSEDKKIDNNELHTKETHTTIKRKLMVVPTSHLIDGSRTDVQVTAIRRNVDFGNYPMPDDDGSVKGSTMNVTVLDLKQELTGHTGREPIHFSDLLIYRNGMSTSALDLGEKNGWEDNIAQLILKEEEGLNLLKELFAKPSIFNDSLLALFPLASRDKSHNPVNDVMFYYSALEKVEERVQTQFPRASGTLRNLIAVMILEILLKLVDGDKYISRQSKVRRFVSEPRLIPQTCQDLESALLVSELAAIFKTIRPLDLRAGRRYRPSQLAMLAECEMDLLFDPITKLDRMRVKINDTLSVLCHYMIRTYQPGFDEMDIDKSLVESLSRNMVLSTIAMRYGMRRTVLNKNYNDSLRDTQLMISKSTVLDTIKVSEYIGYFGINKLTNKVNPDSNMASLAFGTTVYANLPGSNIVDTFTPINHTRNKQLTRLIHTEEMGEMFETLATPYVDLNARDMVSAYSSIQDVIVSLQVRSNLDKAEKGRSAEAVYDAIRLHRYTEAYLDEDMRLYLAMSLAKAVYPCVNKLERFFVFATVNNNACGEILRDHAGEFVFTENPAAVLSMASEQEPTSTWNLNSDGIVGGLHSDVLYNLTSIDTIDGFNKSNRSFTTNVDDVSYQWSEGEACLSEMLNISVYGDLRVVMPKRSKVMIRGYIDRLIRLYNDLDALEGKYPTAVFGQKHGIAVALADLVGKAANTPVGKQLVESLPSRMYRAKRDGDLITDMGELIYHKQLASMPGSIYQIKIFIGFGVMAELGVLPEMVAGEKTTSKIIKIIEDTHLMANATLNK